MNWRKTKAKSRCFCPQSSPGWRRAAPYPGYGTLYINRLLCFVGPRKRSAAGQAVPCSVPVVVPDGGYALSGLRSSIYQPVTLFRRPAQAQRRRASCTMLRSRHCAGWRLTPYPAYLHPSSKVCASRDVPSVSPGAPHPHDDTFVFCLVAKLNR